MKDIPNIVIALWAAYVTAITLILLGMVYVAVHFIAKWW